MTAFGHPLSQIRRCTQQHLSFGAPGFVTEAPRRRRVLCFLRKQTFPTKRRGPLRWCWLRAKDIRFSLLGQGGIRDRTCLSQEQLENSPHVCGTRHRK